MKITLVNQSFSLTRGGLERFSVNLARALCKVGHEVHAYGQSFEDLPGEVTAHHLQVSRKPSWWRVLNFSRTVFRAIRLEGFDVVLGLVRTLGLDVYRMGDGLQKHWMRVRYPFAPWRWLNYLFNPTHLVNLYLERKILGGASTTRIITNSKLVKDQACAYYGITDDRASVVYNGVDHSVFNLQIRASYRAAERAKLGLRDSDVLLLHVSNNWQRKGLGVTMHAMKTLGLTGQNLRLMVIGRGRTSTYRKLARRLQIEDRVFFSGTCDCIEKYYAMGDILVLPSLYDPFSNVCLEAMACGLPVITTRQNGASELIVNGKNGWVQQDARCSIELAQLLKNGLKVEILELMGKSAFEKSQEFTIERNMEETLRVCSQVTNI